MRDRAYRRAYRVVQVVLAAFLVAAWAGPRPVTLSGYRWQVVLTGLAWAALVLPTATGSDRSRPLAGPATGRPGRLLVIGLAGRLRVGSAARSLSWHTA